MAYPFKNRRGVKRNPGRKRHSPKWDRCVEDVKAKGGAYDPYAVCTAQLGEESFKHNSARLKSQALTRWKRNGGSVRRMTREEKDWYHSPYFWEHHGADLAREKGRGLPAVKVSKSFEMTLRDEVPGGKVKGKLEAYRAFKQGYEHGVAGTVGAENPILTREQFADIVHGETFSKALHQRPRPAPEAEVKRIKKLEKLQWALRRELMKRFGKRRSGLYESQWQRLDTDAYYDQMLPFLNRLSKVSEILRGPIENPRVARRQRAYRAPSLGARKLLRKANPSEYTKLWGLSSTTGLWELIKDGHVESLSQWKPIFEKDSRYSQLVIQDKRPSVRGTAFHEKRLKRLGNPSMADADRLYKDFHGRPPTQTTTVETHMKFRDDLGELGDLVELRLVQPNRRKTRLVQDERGNWYPSRSNKPVYISANRHTPMLSSNPEGNQLYIEGGNQYVDLGMVGLTGDWQRDHMLLGVLTHVTYRTEKGFDQFELTDYYHRLGEETGDEPVLLYDELNALLSIAGGRYEVKPEGITN